MHYPNRRASGSISAVRYSARTLVTIGFVQVIIAAMVGTAAAQVTGPKHVVVLRVYFHDYANTSRYTQAQVQGFFTQLNTLWGAPPPGRYL
jgi:hypothetical protein